MTIICVTTYQGIVFMKVKYNFNSNVQSKLNIKILNGDVTNETKISKSDFDKINFFDGDNVFTSFEDGMVVCYLNIKELSSDKKNDRQNGSIIFDVLKKNEKINEFSVDFGDIDENVVVKILNGVLLKSYEFDKYKAKKEREVTLNIIAKSNINELFDNEYSITKGIISARNLVNAPGNELYPAAYAEIAEKLNIPGLNVTVFGEDELEKIGMHSLLSVGRGSVNESKVVVFEYMGDEDSSKTPLALVGKGVTFDTGGISIKPSAGMEEMKFDMGGSAAVFGAMVSIAKSKLKKNVIGIIGCVENMPDGAAYKPGDVINSFAGKTIEVLNTDAEGRLVLVDLVSYVQKQYNVRKIVDLATLTGAILVSLGHEYAGMFTNCEKLKSELESASNLSGEKIWNMPLCDTFDKMIDSKIADVKNIGGRYAGSSTAAHFIQRFVEEGVSWAHLDIAGMAWEYKGTNICPVGASGYGVELLYNFVKGE